MFLKSFSFITAILTASAAGTPNFSLQYFPKSSESDSRCPSAEKGCDNASSTLLNVLTTTPKPDDAATPMCSSPPSVINGQYFIADVTTRLKSKYLYGQNKLIKLKCDPGYIVVGHDIVRCKNGVWKNEFPYCERGCTLQKLPQFSYRCQLKSGGYVDCEDFMPGDTIVNISFDQFDEHSRKSMIVSFVVSCKDGIFHISDQCVKEIENFQKEIEALFANTIKTHKLGPASLRFEDMVNNVHYFEHQVLTKINQVNQNMTKCLAFMNTLSDHQQSTSTRKCLLPETPENGQYSIVTLNKYLPSGEVKDNIIDLKYECQEGFVLVGADSPRCFNGVWLDEFPQCAAGCKLVKKSDFSYHCPNLGSDDLCDEYVPPGSIVKVSRRLNTELVTVDITCRDNGTFNISADCVKEIDQLEREFQENAMIKMTEYETKINSFKSDKADPEFRHLVEEFHSFEKHVNDNLNKMHRKADECDIYLDLLLS